MCGRSSLYEEPRELLESYGLPPRLAGYRPRFNIAPSQGQWVLARAKDGAIRSRELRWGLVPSWASDPSIGAKLINARAETVTQKRSFRDSFRARRCLILADGFYEWAKTGSEKTPFRFQKTGARPFVFAGLWDRWRKDGSQLDTCTIITTRASTATAHIHDRMPVILGFDQSLRWISPEADEDELLQLLQPYGGSDLEIFEVSRAVNTPANDSDLCIQPVGLDIKD
jgi:putative SOS response-associated peptidase YedK